MSKRIKELEEKVSKLEEQVWELKNPPKFKNGDTVYSTGFFELKGKIINYPVRIKLITILPELPIYTWKYEILSKNGISYYVYESNLKKVKG